MNLIRHIQVTFNVNGQIYTYDATGDRTTLDISFNVNKTIDGTPNESTIVIRNLAPSTRQQLEAVSKQIRCDLFVGYVGQDLTLLASGTIRMVFPEKMGAENHTTISIVDGVGGVQFATVNKTYPAGTPIKSLVADLAKNLMTIKYSGNTIDSGVRVSEDRIVLPADWVVGSRGFVANGRVASVLNQLSREYGFTWSIQNFAFQAINDILESPTNTPFQTYLVSYRQSNLIKVTPALQIDFDKPVGMMVEAILNPKVQAGDFIIVESEFYPEYNGTYMVGDAQFTGAIRGMDWRMVLTMRGFPGQQTAVAI